MGIMGVISEVPHPYPWKEEICTKTEERRKPFLRLRRNVMGFKKVQTVYGIWSENVGTWAKVIPPILEPIWKALHCYF